MVVELYGAQCASETNGGERSLMSGESNDRALNVGMDRRFRGGGRGVGCDGGSRERSMNVEERGDGFVIDSVDFWQPGVQLGGWPNTSTGEVEGELDELSELDQVLFSW